MENICSLHLRDTKKYDYPGPTQSQTLSFCLEDHNEWDRSGSIGLGIREPTVIARIWGKPWLYVEQWDLTFSCDSACCLLNLLANPSHRSPLEPPQKRNSAKAGPLRLVDTLSNMDFCKCLSALCLYSSVTSFSSWEQLSSAPNQTASFTLGSKVPDLI